MLSSLYLSSRCRNCCCVATSVLTRSICCVGMFSSVFAVAFRGAGALRRMLSSASLLFALKSGCLNSQAYIPLFSYFLYAYRKQCSYSRPVWRPSPFFVVVSNLVEVVFVELTDETSKVAMFKVLRQDGLGELFVLWKLSGQNARIIVDKGGRLPLTPRSYRAHHPTSRQSHKKDLLTFCVNR